MISAAVILLVGSLVGYVMVGSFVDATQRRRDKQRARAMEVLSRALYADHEGLGSMLAELNKVNSDVLFALALDMPLHFDDELSRRLLDIVGTPRVRRKVRRLATSRLWHRRVRGARLSHLLPSANDLGDRLLNDSVSLVRAAAIESFDSDQIAKHVSALLRMLDDRSRSVRFAAQQALLRGDGRLVDAVAELLPTMTDELAIRGLEVAANLGDPRLVDAVASHASSGDAQIRRLVARSTPFGVPPEELAFLHRLLADESAEVRVASIEAVARLQVGALGATLARALRDRSWEVRRAAGSSLAQLGPVGQVVLRDALGGDDPFARDMATQVLDSLLVDGNVSTHADGVVQPELDSLVDWAAA